ncbi:MAG TPA: head GIN domain-containing protein [Anaerolineales bacterium]|nr:head GIN domain-containing protein [Anaerolineales bacterium]
MKKRTFWIWVLISLLVLSTPACSFNFNLGSDGLPGRKVRGSGNVINEDRSVSEFNKVDKSGRGNLIIELGDEETLRIEAEDNLIEYIETHVSNHTLEISIRADIDMEPTEEIRYYLTVKSLEAITVSGFGTVSIPALEADRFSVDITSFGGVMIGDLETSSLSVDINSFGGVNIENLKAERLSVNISGAGNLVIHGGRVDKQEVNISSLGDYEASELASDDADVHLSNLGSATVRVRDHLRIEISSKGAVHYYGDPEVDANVSGPGEVKQAGK